jgi:hypothetical protein
MKKIIFTAGILTSGLLMAPYSTIFAQVATCPFESQVKSVLLIQAFQDPYDPECWNFISNNFTHDSVQWNVSFGTFLPDAHTSDEALEQGQAYFDSAELRIKRPLPVQIPGETLCNYVPEGEEYWISASSPPELESQSKTIKNVSLS